MDTEMITPDSENDIFRLASEFVNETSQHLFLTGKAGTGKTTFLKYIRNHSHKRVLVAAPTGVAAVNAGGTTMHSLFQLPFEPFIPNSRLKFSFKFGKAKIDMLKQVELLIIDEVSMVRCDMLDAVDSTMRFVRHDPRPFGGVQVLYIGDMFQLPPVVKDETWEILKQYYPSPFFFHAKVIERVPPVYLELKKVYRQKEQLFVDLLNRVRNDQMTNADIEILNRRHIPNYTPDPDNPCIILTTHNSQADRINTEKLAAIPLPVQRFKGQIKGEFPAYALPTDLDLELKVGAQIMFLKNDISEQKRFYNGKLAEISRIDGESIYAIPIGQNNEFKIEQDKWTNVRFTLNKEKGEIEEEELGSFVQYPIRTAWAITIHKSQGLTFERAIIDIGQAFAAGQAYVALSRCTSLEGIVLRTRLTHNCIRTDKYAVAFADNEKPVDQLEQILGNSKQVFWTERLLKYFDWKPLLILLHDYRKLTSDRISDDLRNAHEMSEQLYNKALEQQGIALKFQTQLRQLMNAVRQSSDLQQLKERCTKAVIFFYEDIRINILKPLQQHKSEFTKIKKAKAYWKALNTLEEDIINFTIQITAVRFNNEPMLPDNISLPELQKNFFTPSQSSKEHNQKSNESNGTDKEEGSTKGKSIATGSSTPREKLPVGESKRVSLNMFKAGKSAEEISKERNFALSTIEGHLIEFIKTGEVEIKEFLAQNKIDAILPYVKKTIEGDKTKITPIREELGEAYSFNEIKAVINHWLYISEKEMNKYCSETVDIKGLHE